MHTVAALVIALCLSFPSSVEAPTPRDEGWIEFRPGVFAQPIEAPAPFFVVVWPDAEDWGRIYEKAVQNWNFLVGFDLFVYLGVSEMPVIPALGVIPILIDEHKVNRADTMIQANQVTGVMHHAFIVMPVGHYSDAVAVHMAMHELGHVLGLAHDPELPASLMHPVIEDLEATLTDSDIQRIREAYGPRPGGKK